MTADVTVDRGPRRAVILAVVIVVLAVGVASGRSHSRRTAKPVSPVEAAVRPNRGALSTAWYCPGLPASFPTRDQTVTLSNLGSKDVDAVVTVQPDSGDPRIVRTVTVPRYTVQSFDRSTLAPVSPGGTARASTARPLPPGPVVVEPFSPDVVVEAGAETSDRLDPVPCANVASTDWYFSAGTTVRGVSQWLVLDDPYSTDARVDVTLRTDSGLLQLPGLQGIDVPGRSRVVIAVHDQAVRQARVAVQVHASVGRVVAAQTLQFDRASGTPGLATAIGALAPASQWRFADGEAFAGSSQWVALTDMSQLQVQVAVQAVLGSNVIVPPVVVSVPAGAVSWVQIGGCGRTQSNCLRVPTNAGFQLQAQADNRLPIVAQTLSRFGDPKRALGATTSMGSTVPARDWVVGRTRVDNGRSTSISVTNAGVSAAHVSVRVVHAGIAGKPVGLQHFTIAANTRFVLPGDTAGPTHRLDAAVVISSDEPVFVESTIYGSRDATRSPGVPSR